MPSSFEETKAKLLADVLTGNNLRSVYIDKNSKGDNFGVKVYHEDPFKAKSIAEQLYKELKENHP